MPIPTVITDLSTTAASNSPQGSESPTEGDNYLRAIQAIMRREHDDFGTASSAGVGAGLVGYASANTYAAGTVGKAIKDFSDSSTATVGDALLAAKRTATGAQATTWHNILEKSPINAQADFGCAGDGVTNDTANLQAAATAAIAQKRALYIPGGTYLLNGTAGADTYANGLLLPFDEVNADPDQSLVIYGDGGLTRLQANANNLILLRIARNNVMVRDICLDSNGKTGVILCGIVPESMTQTTTLVSQSYITLRDVDLVGGASVDGIVIQPGPRVTGSDSGCFYHNIIGGMWNFVGGGRHVFLKKGATWATDANRPTRTNFIGCRAIRGNVGYYFEVGSEIQLIGCNEELIANDTTPLATPTARWVSADASNINFFGGYSEACTQNFDGAANNVNSWGYIPSGGASVADWRTYANSWVDGIADDEAWTPVVASSGGGAEGTSTSTGRYTKHGKIIHFTCQVSVGKGTLGAGNISVTGLPFIADSNWTGADFQGIPVTKMDGITLGTNNVALVAYISGATLNMRKMHGSGAGMANLTVADCSATIVFTVQGWYKAV